MRRTGTLFLALGLVCFSLAGCSNGGGEEDQFSAPETSDQDDTEAGVDVVETVDIRQADEISAPDLEIHFPDLQETVDIVVPPETTDEVEILVEIEVEVLPEIEDEYVPPPSDVGQECDSELDCDTNGGCVLGFCTVICRADGEEIDGACDNSNPDSDWGLVFQCPADVDVCMPGDVAGVEITCQTDSFCLEAGLAGFACAGALPFAGVELAGRCVPKGDRKPAGAACQGDGDSCISLLCVNENLDPDKKGRCSGYCEAGDNVPDDTVCSMLPIFDEDGDVIGYAPLVTPIDGSAEPCDSLSDCEVGEEYCGAVIQPGSYESAHICVASDATDGGWLGDSCSANKPCFGDFCLFEMWANKVAAYCSQACETDEHCGNGMECRTVHLAPFEGVVPSGDFEMGVCLKVSQGSPCFIGEEGVCAYDWSFCELIPGGGWIGNCVDGECPPDCEGKACKAEDGCGGACLGGCLANGELCGGGAECLSDLCVDGVCCDSLCDGVCESCGQPDFLGTCLPFEAGSDPAGECDICHACDGASACAPVPAGADPENACGICQVCGEEGTCVPVETGVDPDLECGMCKVCDGEGACGPVEYGLDTKEDCEETESTTCLTTGICNGEGSCDIWAEGTICGEAKCQAFMYVPESMCNGKGVCAPQPAQQCSPYTCDEETVQCNTSCQDTAECTMNYWCLDAECQAKPQCPVKTKLICDAQVPGTTLGHQNDWTNYGCAPMVPYIGPDRIYSLTMESDTKITVSLQEAEFDSALMLLQHACDPENACATYADSFNAGGEETMDFIAKAGVEYHLAVDGYSEEDKGDYKITAECCEMTCAAENACGDDGCGDLCGECAEGEELCVQGLCNACADDPGGEPNDACADAIPAGPGVMEGNLLCPAGDMDWFEFELAEGETITFLAEFEGEGIDLNLALYGPGCETFVVEAATEMEEEEMLEHLVTEAGTYFLMVYAVDMKQTSYDLDVKLTAPQCMTNADCFGGKLCGLYKCVLPPKPCEAISQPVCGAFIAGDTTGKPANHTNYTTCTDVPFEAPEDVYSMTFEEETVVTVSLGGQGFHAGLAVLEDYCATSWACVAFADGGAPGAGAQVAFKAKPGKLYYLLVDGKAEEDVGNYSFDVSCCIPQCDGKVCGDDGCGMDCGTCPGEAYACIEGECICQPSCDGKECGDDGCGGDCGSCEGEQDACEEGLCVCQPMCDGLECGDDGCDGSCGECEGEGIGCVEGACACLPQCEGKVCGDDACGGLCGVCEGEQETCDEEGQCICQPSCDGKECGDDGCGGICAECQGPQDDCVDFKCECQSACQGKECGDDGCGGICGECAISDSCVDSQCTCSDDLGLEPNDVCAQASPVTPATYPNMAICEGGDQDWYSIGVKAGETLKVTAAFVHTIGDLDLYLYKKGNCVGYLGSASTSTDDEVIEYKSQTQSDYLIRVVGYNGFVSNLYDLMVEVY